MLRKIVGQQDQSKKDIFQKADAEHDKVEKDKDERKIRIWKTYCRKTVLRKMLLRKTRPTKGEDTKDSAEKEKLNNAECWRRRCRRKECCERHRVATSILQKECWGPQSHAMQHAACALWTCQYRGKIMAWDWPCGWSDQAWSRRIAQAFCARQPWGLWCLIRSTCRDIFFLSQSKTPGETDGNAPAERHSYLSSDKVSPFYREAKLRMKETETSLQDNTVSCQATKFLLSIARQNSCWRRRKRPCRTA